MERGSQLEWRVNELEKDVEKLGDVPTQIALLVQSVSSLESRFKNLQRGFYFFGTTVVAGAIGFGFFSLRVFSQPAPDPSALAGGLLRMVGL